MNRGYRPIVIGCSAILSSSCRAASPLYQDRSAAPFPLTPSDVSLEIGNAVVYEWCARAYSWWRGGV
jgi:hypothetical protein